MSGIRAGVNALVLADRFQLSNRVATRPDSTSTELCIRVRENGQFAKEFLHGGCGTSRGSEAL